MKACVPGLLDRLMGESAPAGRLAVERIKDGIARDLEALLNTRIGIAPEVFDAYPQARTSILNYGLVDFAGYCLSSGEDRAAVCASLKDAIERHEPRLSNVSATLENGAGGVNRLNFVIDATLRVAGNAEPVNFNAVLQPSMLQYSISKAGRPARP